MRKETLRVLEEIDGKVTFQVFGPYDEDEAEAQEIWTALFIEEAKKRGINKKDIEKYLNK